MRNRAFRRFPDGTEFLRARDFYDRSGAGRQLLKNCRRFLTPD
jgi:hypothetical protein